MPTETEAPGVRVAALYGDPSEPGWAAAFRAGRAGIRGDDGAADRSAVAPPRPSPASPSTRCPRARVAAAAATDACTNAQYTLWQGAWTSRSYGYRVNRSKFNYNDTTVASIVGRPHELGHDVQRLRPERHHEPDLDVPRLDERGHPHGARRPSVTDRGDLAAVGCAGALACTWLFTDAAGNATETDQRFNDDLHVLQRRGRRRL